jgi:hypothetical protein
MPSSFCFGLEGVVTDPETRRSFIARVGIAVFAALPALKAMASPRLALARADCTPCVSETCQFAGCYGIYCVYDCYDLGCGGEYCESRFVACGACGG